MSTESIRDYSEWVAVTLRKLPLVTQNTPVELVTDPEPRLLQCIQVRLDSLDGPTLLGVDEHSDEAEMRNVEMGGGLSTVPLIHQQHGPFYLHGQCDGLGFSRI